MHIRRLAPTALVWTAVASLFAPASGAEVSPRPAPKNCAELFAATRAFVEGSAGLASHADWNRYRAGHRALVDGYAARGLTPAFVARQLAALAFARRPLNLKLLDLTSAEFRDFVRADPVPALRRLHARGREVGGLTFVSVRRGIPHAVIAVDPAAGDLDYADVLMEEALHLRLRQHWQGLEFADGHRPHVFEPAGAGFMHLLDEFVVKETLYVRGHRRPRDRADLLVELVADVRRRPETAARGFNELVATLLGCAAEHGAAWANLPLPRLLRCAYVADGARVAGWMKAFDTEVAQLADGAVAESESRIRAAVKMRRSKAGID